MAKSQNSQRSALATPSTNLDSLQPCRFFPTVILAFVPFAAATSGSTIHAWTGKLDISLVTLARAFFPLTYPAHGAQVHLSKRPSLSCCPAVGTYSYRLSSHIVEVPSHWQDLNSGGGGAGVHCK